MLSVLRAGALFPALGLFCPRWQALGDRSDGQIVRDRRHPGRGKSLSHGRQHRLRRRAGDNPGPQAQRACSGVIIGKDTRDLRLHAGECARVGGHVHGRHDLPGRSHAYARPWPISPRACVPMRGWSSPRRTTPTTTTGIKVFSGTGYKLSDEQEAEIEALVLGGKPAGDGAAATRHGAGQAA